MVTPRKAAKGYLFPLPQKLLDRIFSGCKDIFVKIGRFRLLKSSDTLLFYNSDLHKIVGEALIKEKVESEASDIWQKFGCRIFLEQSEYNSYVKESVLGPRSKGVRASKIMTAFILTETKRYQNPKLPEKRVTPSGYYLPIERSS